MSAIGLVETIVVQQDKFGYIVTFTSSDEEWTVSDAKGNVKRFKSADTVFIFLKKIGKNNIMVKLCDD
ncbi:hypothetical protein HQQ94_17910 [Shewanella sp. VB17]|uniref:hypothetical protein n=1 Tax=Shewanella sp. VB17 TaxID=2739432 RepID=UPI001564A506|nr:hypothetical protein [Shewanella sp. VB17]NRD75057.1 hypothetical protein [Shewanella sp. VB17]